MSQSNKSIQRSTGYWITRLARSMEKGFDNRLRPLGITRGAYALLSAIHHDDKTRPAELAAYLGLDGAAITRYLDRVEELGFIEREPNADDRRSTHINLTTEGRRIVQLGQASSKATNEKLTAGLTAAEVQCFHIGIQKMLARSGITVGEL